MLTSSTLTFSMGSGERKRCSNMAPVRRLRNLAWMKARRLPGVRCSTLNTECKSLLCLMIMPGRSWVAGIDIGGLHLLHSARNSGQRGRSGGPSGLAFGLLGWGGHGFRAALGLKTSFYTGGEDCGGLCRRFAPEQGLAGQRAGAEALQGTERACPRAHVEWQISASLAV